MISTAAGASAISAAIDTLFNGRLSGFSNSAMDLVMRNDGSTTKPSSVNLERPRSNKFASLSHQRELFNSQSNLTAFERYSMLFDGSTYRPDFMAAILCILMTLVLISGVKKSVKFNNYLNLFNAGVFLFIIIAALPLLSMRYWKADFYNNNLVTNNYLNRSRQIQQNLKYNKTGHTSYRVPYQRGIINRWEVENTNFDRHLIKRSIGSSNRELNSIYHKNKLLYKIRNKYEKEKNLRTRFENFFNQRLRRSLVNNEENKRTKSEHEANVAGFGDEEEEDEDESIITPAPRFSSTTPKPSSTTMKIELPTFKTMIRFTTSTTTLEPEEFYPEQPIYTLAPIEKTTTERTTTTKAPATTVKTIETTSVPSTTTTTTTTTTTEKPSSTSTKRPFLHDSEEEEEEEESTTEPILEETTTEGSYEEESTTKQEISEEEELSPKIIGKGPLIRSTTENSAEIISTTSKPKSKSTKTKGKSKSKQIAKAIEASKKMENGFFQFGWEGKKKFAATL